MKQNKKHDLVEWVSFYFEEGKMKPQEVSESTTQEEEKEEEISGAQFLCETIIRSLTLEEAPDHRPLRRAQHGRHKTLGGRSLLFLYVDLFNSKIIYNN